MADIIINITGSAAGAERSVDALIGKLQELSQTLDRVGSKVGTAFSGMNSFDTSKLDDLSRRLDEIDRFLTFVAQNAASLRTTLNLMSALRLRGVLP